MVATSVLILLAFVLAVISSGSAFLYFMLFVSGVQLHMLSQAMTWSRPAGILLLLVVALVVLGFTIYTLEAYMKEARRGQAALYRKFLAVTAGELLVLPIFHLVLAAMAAFGPLGGSLQVIDGAAILGSLTLGWVLRRRVRGLRADVVSPRA